MSSALCWRKTAVLLLAFLLIACQEAAPEPLAPAPLTVEELEPWLVSAWENGRNPAEVRSALRTAGWQSNEEQWLSLDMDGDLQDEWAIVLISPETKRLPNFPFNQIGDFWIINQHGLAYQYAHDFPDESLLSDGFYAPVIAHKMDITGDTLPELFYVTERCGSRGCSYYYRILSSKNNAIEQLDMEYSNRYMVMRTEETHFEDHQEDGIFDFYVYVSGGYNGIARNYTEVWSWNGAYVEIIEEIPEWTHFRHHVLYNANDALALNNLDEASSLYQDAMHSLSLVNPAPFYGDNIPESVEDSIVQFATVRLIYIDLLNDNDGKAAERFQFLQESYPKRFAVEAAYFLIDGYQNGVAMTEICNQINVAAQEIELPTGHLANLGYSNPGLGASSYCP